MRRIFLAIAVTAVVAPAGASAAPLARMAFTSGDDDALMNAGGSARATLIRSANSPAWSPDGAQIAYVKELRHDRSQIWVARADGTGAHAVTPAPARGGVEGSPAWSPDGRTIAFIRFRPGENHILSTVVLVPARGGRARSLVTARTGRRLVTLEYPAWSPDGTRVFYSRSVLDDKAYFEPSLYSVPVTGGPPSLFRAGAYSPTWSPDGNRMAFVSVTDHNGDRCGEDECSWAGEIYVAGTNGSGAQRVTNEDGDDANPAWSPDGQRIAFDSDRNYPAGQHHEVYSMRPDGSCLTWLTNGSRDSGDPAWEPGAGRSSDPGGCALLSLPPLVEAAPPRHSPLRGVTLWWLGPTPPGGLLLEATDRERIFFTFIYDDCGLFDPAGCGQPLQVQISSSCGDHPLHYGGPASFDPAHAFDYRGVLVNELTSGDFEVYTGGTTVTLSGSDAGHVRALVDALRPVGATGPPAKLPPPAFRRSFWRALNVVSAAYRRTHSVAAGARSLHMPRGRFVRRLGLARLLAPLGRQHVARCVKRSR